MRIMEPEKPYCQHGESDASFALAMTMVWSVITLVLAIPGVISLF